MAATPISVILQQVRNQLVEPTAKFWTDAELTAILALGAQDLWGAILDLHQDHYFKVSTDPILVANATEISFIPADCFRVLLIEPADTTLNGVGHQVLFVPRKYNSTDFNIARTMIAQDPTTYPSQMIYYDITGVGAPLEPPHILIAPPISSNLNLRLVYNPSIDVTDFNPIPGASDNALKAWTIAYAMAKEGDAGTRVPDPAWLGIYGTEKQMILTRLTPREEQEPDVVEDLFQGYGNLW